MKQNRYLEAFKENYNLVGLATATATAAALLNPLPLLIGVVAEAAYLMFYADSRWYAARMAQKFDAEVEARRAGLKARILPHLAPEMQSRFNRLEQTRRSLQEQKTDPENEDWFRGVLRKLDFLLEKWLEFADKDLEFVRYLASVREQLDSGATPRKSSKNGGLLSSVPLSPGSSAQDRQIAQRRGSAARGGRKDDTSEWVKTIVAEIQAAFDAEVAEIAEQRSAQTDSNTTSVLDRRTAILKQRRESVEKIARIHNNLENQLALVEDTIGLISDGVRARSPEQVLAAIDDVVSQTTTMTQLLEDVAPYEQLLAS